MKHLSVFSAQKLQESRLSLIIQHVFKTRFILLQIPLINQFSHLMISWSALRRSSEETPRISQFVKCVSSVHLPSMKEDGSWNETEELYCFSTRQFFSKDDFKNEASHFLPAVSLSLQISRSLPVSSRIFHGKQDGDSNENSQDDDVNHLF